MSILKKIGLKIILPLKRCYFTAKNGLYLSVYCVNVKYQLPDIRVFAALINDSNVLM